jgi:hypothetical protein
LGGGQSTRRSDPSSRTRWPSCGRRCSSCPSPSSTTTSPTSRFVTLQERGKEKERGNARVRREIEKEIQSRQRRPKRSCCSSTVLQSEQAQRPCSAPV